MPRYHRPDSPISSQWPASAAYQENGLNHQSVPQISISWNDFFSDPRLHQLIALSLKNNRDLRVSTLNVELERAEYHIGLAAIFPTIDASGNGLRQKEIVTGNQATKTGLYSLTLGVSSYEVDLFGRLRSLKEQALQTYFATIEARRSAQISLVAQVATQYLTERELAELLMETKATLKSSQSNYQLIKASYDVGNDSLADLRSAEIQMQTARANLFNYQRQHDQAINDLVLLIGEPLPANLPSPQPFNSEKILTDIPAGLPSDLIERRPDILEAEDQLKAANANIGAARAAFFPKILLTSSGGIASAKLTDLFTGPSVWSFGPEITMPIFDGGNNRANLDYAKISKSIQIAQYEKAIQTAFKEVADALTARANDDGQVEAQEALIKSEQGLYELAEIRYRNGIDSYLEVLTAEEDLYSAQQVLVQVQFARLSNLITLYQALGGDW